MTKRFYVGNIPFEFRDEDLRLVAEAYGEVLDAKVITTHAARPGDRIESRGFGFVEMATDAGARRVAQEMQGAMVKGRDLRIREAVPRAKVA